jgi:hypothetical protein
MGQDNERVEAEDRDNTNEPTDSENTEERNLLPLGYVQAPYYFDWEYRYQQIGANVDGRVAKPETVRCQSTWTCDTCPSMLRCPTSCLKTAMTRYQGMRYNNRPNMVSETVLKLQICQQSDRNVIPSASRRSGPEVNNE